MDTRKSLFNMGWLKLAIAIASLAITACTPEEPPAAPPPPPVPPAVNSLTAGSSKTWKVVETRTSADTATIDDSFCDGDDRFTFSYQNSGFFFNNGALKCDNNIPSTLNGRWELTNQNNLRIFRADGSQWNTYEVRSISTNQLVVGHFVATPSGAEEREEVWMPLN